MALATQRRSLAMWEFSWLVRRGGHDAEYADWDAVLDQAVERGYDILRIDAFPHLIAADGSGRHADLFTIVPQPGAFMWGNHTLVDVEPRTALVEFISKARDRGIDVGLSSWFNDDLTHRCDQIVEPDDYVRIWRETLELLDSAGLHGSIAWVDLCNEFPLGDWAHQAHIRVFHKAWRDPTAAFAIWSGSELAAVNRYYQAVRELKATWPDLNFTFSMATLPPNAMHLDVSPFDIVEPHIWLSTSELDFFGRTRFADFLTYLPDATPRHVGLVDDVYWPEREKWLDRLAFVMRVWADWAHAQGKPLYNTEGWASTVYDDHPTPSGRDPWDYVRDVGRASVRMAVDLGWVGICTSNFSQPHFGRLWADSAWHRELNDTIHGG